MGGVAEYVLGLATALGRLLLLMRPIMSFYLPWQVLTLTGGAVLIMVFLSSLICIRRVLVLEPAAVFQL